MTDLLATAHEAASTLPSPLPAARGPLSAALLADLVAGSSSPAGTGSAAAGTSRDARATASAPDLAALAAEALAATDDVVRDDDVQLSLFCLYELHHAGLEGVDDDREWDPR
ncbi:hypothetical protein BC477_18265 [Clavibacter michiganensis subsp. michiganensis]|uniref:Uncharacterized protein n=3 Tax=Clavibacter michiganensis TaxID=28447 RepID=A0A251XGU7_CLAMM|nr:hypothetical protein BC477_18265 [Clavibacter michiganensis subsp. michiganensis]OUE01427.1 hypothetical protein CMMCAS07_14050 [Clavibacter michiganensis subsp. michiganensis]